MHSAAPSLSDNEFYRLCGRRSSGPSTRWAVPLSRAGDRDRRGAAGDSGLPDAPRPGVFRPR